MIRKEIVDFIANTTGLKEKALIEKDALLSQILTHLVADKDFSEHYAFKGGTCLIRCYLDYYRFSEDLDFTYTNSQEFKGKSEKKIREIISGKIDSVAVLLEDLASLLQLRFKALKTSTEYVQFGGSNAFVTFKLWYRSQQENKETFIKVQINYRESLKYPVKIVKALPLLSKHPAKEVSVLFPEESSFLLNPISVLSYDIKDILIEKIRAILTRRGVKARDFIDVYQITHSQHLNVEDFTQDFISRTRDMLKYEKYKTHLTSKTKGDFSFNRDEETAILLVPLPDDYESFLTKFQLFLQRVAKEI